MSWRALTPTNPTIFSPRPVNAHPARSGFFSSGRSFRPFRAFPIPHNLLHKEAMLRVLHMADRLSAYGGADRHMLGILELSQGRAETRLVFGRDDRSVPLSERRRIGPMARCKGLDRSGLAPRGGRGALRRLAAAINDFEPEVIHIHNVVDPALTAAAARLAPCVAIVQDHRPFCPGRGMITPSGQPCRRPLGSHCAACFDDMDYFQALAAVTRRRLKSLGLMRRVLVLSQYMAAMLTKAGLRPSRLRVLPPFVHRITEKPTGDPGGYHLLACRLVRHKGVAVALDAAGMMRGGPPLWVAGSGPMQDEIVKRARNSGGRIVFKGWQDRRGMSAMLAGARSLWLPSLWAEPFGIVGLEALHLGIPAIASDVGGVGDWLDHGQSGYIVPPGDAAALADAAARLDDGSKAQKMGANGLRFVRARFDPADLMDRLFRLYEAAKAAPRVIA